MFMHNKRLQYTVRVSQPNPVLASFLLEQFGGPDGELAAAQFVGRKAQWVQDGDNTSRRTTRRRTRRARAWWL